MSVLHNKSLCLYFVLFSLFFPQALKLTFGPEWVLVAQSCPTLCDWPHGLQSSRLFCLWDFPGKDTGEGCHFLFQGIFQTQGSNPNLLPCRQILYWLNYKDVVLLSLDQIRSDQSLSRVWLFIEDVVLPRLKSSNFVLYAAFNIFKTFGTLKD